MSAASRERHAEEFTWEDVAGRYEELLRRFLPHHDQTEQEPHADRQH